ncbi:unnamed protein product, partial [Rangifer tarandus platyrhynchus]
QTKRTRPVAGTPRPSDTRSARPTLPARPGPALGQPLTGRHGDPEPRSPPRRASAGPRRARRPHHDGPAARAAEAGTRGRAKGRESRRGPPLPRRLNGQQRAPPALPR